VISFCSVSANQLKKLHHQIIDEYINENIYSEIKTVTIYVKIIALSMFSVSAI
jgi:hypothetical protein